jgi:holo-[acyl-carrier protein] synthase
MLATGVDMVVVSRLARILNGYGSRFLERVFTPGEVVSSRGRPAELAARFAAKEAVSKALGVGMRLMSPAGIGWLEVETLNHRSGQPYLTLYGRAQELASAAGLATWAISLTHDGDLALAFVVALGPVTVAGSRLDS